MSPPALLDKQALQEAEFRLPYHWLSKRSTRVQYRRLSDLIAERIAAHLPGGGTILDAGCGDGRGTADLHERLGARGFVLCGVDYSERAILHALAMTYGSGLRFAVLDLTTGDASVGWASPAAEENRVGQASPPAEEAGVGQASTPDGASVGWASRRVGWASPPASVAAGAPPAEDADRFDAILLREVLEHLPDADVPPALRSLHAALREAGRLIVSVPSSNLPVSAKHYRHYGPRTLRQTLESHGFVIHELLGFGYAPLYSERALRLNRLPKLWRVLNPLWRRVAPERACTLVAVAGKATRVTGPSAGQ